MAIDEFRRIWNDGLRVKNRTWYLYLATLFLAELFGYFSFTTFLGLFNSWTDSHIKTALAIIAGTSCAAYLLHKCCYRLKNKYLADQTLARERHLLSTVLNSHPNHVRELIQRHHASQRRNDVKSGIVQSTDYAGLAATRITANTFARVEFEFEFSAHKGLIVVSVILTLVPTLVFICKTFLIHVWPHSIPPALTEIWHALKIHTLSHLSGFESLLVLLPFILSLFALIWVYDRITRERIDGDEIAQKIDNETMTAIQYLRSRDTLRRLDAFHLAETKIWQALLTSNGIRLALAKAYSWSGGAKSLIYAATALSIFLVLVFNHANLADMAILSAIVALSGRYAENLAEFFALCIRRKKQNYANGLLLDLERLPGLPRERKPAKDEFDLFTVRDVTLGNPDEGEILHHVSFSIKRGERIGILGTTGAGKTTLINALIGDALPSSGTITTDGVAPEALTPQWLAKSIGFLPQRPHLFNATLRENICLCESPGVPDETLHAILRATKLDADLKKHRTSSCDPLDMRISDNGDNLSVGEMSKVAMARILARNPGIWIVDEFDSALDEASKNLLTKLLPEKSDNKTLLIVSHHPSDLLALGLDRILVLENGTVTSGTPHELKNKKGLFNRLYSLEIGADTDAEHMTEDNFPATKEGVRAALQQSPIFAQLNWTTTAKLADCATLINLPAGQVVVKCGDPGETMFAILAGQVEINGRRDLCFGPGYSFGEIALFAPHAIRTATVRCKTDCTFAELPRAAVIGLCEREPSATLEILKATAAIAARESNAAQKAKIISSQKG